MLAESHLATVLARRADRQHVARARRLEGLGGAGDVLGTKRRGGALQRQSIAKGLERADERQCPG